MKITIINGLKDVTTNPLQMQLEMSLVKLSAEHEIDLFTVEAMDINYCCGCFGCWVKTPGKCIYKDDMEDVVKSMAHTDLLLIVSEAHAGFVSAEAKKAMDRILPIFQPYIKIYEGENHHVPRYDNEFNLGVLVLDDGTPDIKAREIIFDTFDRLGRNTHSDRVIKAAASAENMLEVLQNEICCS